MKSVSPNIFVKDINKTIEFYKQLGFGVVFTVPAEGNPDWVMMKNGDVTFMFQTFPSLGEELPAIKREDGGSLLFYIQVEGLRKLHEQIKDKAEIVKGIEKTFYGATEFSILDLNGYILTFAEDEAEAE